MTTLGYGHDYDAGAHSPDCDLCFYERQAEAKRGPHAMSATPVKLLTEAEINGLETHGMCRRQLRQLDRLIAIARYARKAHAFHRRLKPQTFWALHSSFLDGVSFEVG